MSRRSSRGLNARKSVKRLWTDRVRENSVVKQFGPKTSHVDNVVVQRVMIQNVLDIMRSPGGCSTLVSSRSGDCGNVEVTKIPVMIVTEGLGSRRASDVPDCSAVPLVGSSEANDSNSQPDPIRKYIVLPSVNFTMSKAGDANDADVNNEASFKLQGDKWPDASQLMRGATCQKVNVDGQGARLSDCGEKVEVSSVSYLTVPNTPGPRRPSTADLVIEKLNVEKLDGGGLSIQGVALASNCHITLSVFGTFFLVAGLILTYISFSVSTMKTDPGSDDTNTGNEKRITEHVSSVAQMRKIGPSFISLGLLMLLLGITFYALAKKISRDEKARRRAIAEHQLNQLESSFSYAHATTSPMHTIAPAPHEQYPILSVRRNSWWMDQTPVENTYQTNPDARDFAVQCPSPHGDGQVVTSPTTISPVPSEVRVEPDETYVGIACFPPSPMKKVNSESSMVTMVTSGSQGLDPSSQGQTQSHPHSAGGSRGLAYPFPVLSDNYPSSASNVPYIQVTSVHPQSTPMVPQLPRLSRHCSTRRDSRPTTADSR